MKLKDECMPVGFTEGAKEAQRYANIRAWKLVTGNITDEEKSTYFKELAARVELRYLIWECELLNEG